MIAAVGMQSDSSRAGDADLSPHGSPYPDRLHAHLSAAADAAATLAAVEAESGPPTPAALVDEYGAAEAVNTSQSEGGQNE